MAKKTAKSTPKKNDETLGLVLSYLGILVLIPFLFFKKTERLAFHCRQGLALAIIEVLLWAVTGILPFVGSFFGLMQLVVFVVGIIAMVRALQGVDWTIPVVDTVTNNLPK